jgi:uncharacterized protein
MLPNEIKKINLMFKLCPFWVLCQESLDIVSTLREKMQDTGFGMQDSGYWIFIYLVSCILYLVSSPLWHKNRYCHDFAIFLPSYPGRLKETVVRICIDDIKDQGLSIVFEEKPEDFPILEGITKTGESYFPGALKFRVRAIRIKEIVEVEGRFDTKVRLTCSRCLEQFETTMGANFVITYNREQPEITTLSGGDGIEISAEEAGLIMYSGREIDLREALEEQVVMSIPIQPICAETCRGLCSRCGTDLNAGDCDCREGTFNIKFAALKNLKLDKKQ